MWPLATAREGDAVSIFEGSDGIGNEGVGQRKRPRTISQGEAGEDTELCVVCEERPSKPKRKQCALCAADIMVARREARKEKKL